MKNKVDRDKVSKYVGSRIKAYRVSKKMTQKELGEKLGVKHNTISSYENGATEPEQNTLYRIASILGVSINDFFPQDQVVEITPTTRYQNFDTSISAGLPAEVDGITDKKTVEIPDSVMGRYAGQSDIFITTINGESMNKVIPNQSFIAVKPVEIQQIKNGDIIVYSDNGDYSVKRFYRHGEQLIFKPDSNDESFFDYVTTTDNDDLIIHGKVVVYIVELD